MAFIEDAFFGGAERKAAKQQRKANEAGIAEQRRQFDQTRADILPTIEAGNAAREEEMAFLGLNGRQAEQDAIDRFIESPGQAFLRQRAERAITRNASATGGLGGGSVLRALSENAIGFAATQLSDRQNRLAQLSGSGQVGATNLGAIGANTAANIAGLHNDTGRAMAAGTMGRASAIKNTLGRVALGFTG